MDAKILARIQKLLALANSGNEHEAEIAATKAHELLIRHNLTMADAVRDLNPVVDEGVDQRTFKETEANFVDRILNAHFFVRVYYQRKPGPLYGLNNSPPTWWETHTKIVGRKENVEIARYIRAFLVQTFRSLWRERKRAGAQASEQRGYYLGLEKGLRTKLNAQMLKVTTEMSLVIVPDPGLVNFMESLSLTNARGRAIEDTESYHQGLADGKKIQIRRGLDGDSVDSQKALPSGKKK